MDEHSTSEHWHEITDRTYLLADTFERFVLQAAAVQSDPEIRAVAERIGEDLGRLYQLAGARM